MYLLQVISKLVKKVDAIVDPFWNCYLLFYIWMRRATSSARHAWATNYLTSAIAIATDLLNHKGTLSNGLKALATAATAGWRWGSGFCLWTFASWTNISATIRNSFWAAFNSLHKLYLQVHHDVLAFSLNGTLSLLAVCTKHFFKFFKNVPKTASTPLLPELLLKALKAGKPLAERLLASKRILLLLIPCHSGLIVNIPLLLITECLISVA